MQLLFFNFKLCSVLQLIVCMKYYLNPPDHLISQFANLIMCVVVHFVSCIFYAVCAWLDAVTAEKNYF